MTLSSSKLSGFNIDSAKDRTYPLFARSHTSTSCDPEEIALNNVDRKLLEQLASTAHPETVLDALLTPTDSARAISAVVGANVVGTLPDAGVISGTQLARIYASGFIPSCKLIVSPGDSVLARIRLFATPSGVPFNNPPDEDWALMPSGDIWPIEPLRISPLRCISEETQVLFELRSIEDLIYAFLNGAECGILDVDAADALAGAVEHSRNLGLVPIARGWIHKDQQSNNVTMHLNALPFNSWSKENFRLPRNVLPTLVPFEVDTRRYQPGLLRFVNDHESVPHTHPVPKKALLTALRDTSPLVCIFLGLLHVVIGLAIHDFSTRGSVGFIGFGIIVALLGAWITACRRRDTSKQIQPRYWGVLGPIAIIAAIPSLVFANVGLLVDGQHTQDTLTSANMTTMPLFPGTFELNPEPGFPAEDEQIEDDHVGGEVKEPPSNTPAHGTSENIATADPPRAVPVGPDQTFWRLPQDSTTSTPDMPLNSIILPRTSQQRDSDSNNFLDSDLFWPTRPDEEPTTPEPDSFMPSVEARAPDNVPPLLMNPDLHRIPTVPMEPVATPEPTQFPPGFTDAPDRGDGTAPERHRIR